MITKFKQLLSSWKHLLLENKYFALNKKTSRIIAPATVFDKEILINGLLDLYLKDLLTQQKNKVVAQYDEQIKIQQIMSTNPKYSHSTAHRDVMRNIEILLNNIANINDALANIILNNEILIAEHLKKALKLDDIKIIKHPTIK